MITISGLFNIAQSAQTECGRLLKRPMEKNTSQKNQMYSRKGAAAQEAHEAIRPT